MKILAADNLAMKGVAHGFFTRQGGVSQGIFASLNCGPGSGDDREAVIENRRRALAALAVREGCLITPYQIHGAEAVCADIAWQMSEPPRADAVATRVRGLTLGILTADCAPILLADEEAGVVGAAHAGWRGALSGVVESAIAAMERLGAACGRIAAAIGPCIARKNYEVGEDLHSQFLNAESANARFFEPGQGRARWHFDLPAFVAARLEQAGLLDIATLQKCTYERETEFFSFRRATHRGEADYGRQLSAIALSA